MCLILYIYLLLIFFQLYLTEKEWFMDENLKKMYYIHLIYIWNKHSLFTEISRGQRNMSSVCNHKIYLSNEDWKIESHFYHWIFCKICKIKFHVNKISPHKWISKSLILNSKHGRRQNEVQGGTTFWNKCVSNPQPKLYILFYFLYRHKTLFLKLIAKLKD